ncbi:MAG: NAD(P)/FAD-dependent oxidoreductase, partial [Bacteroidia bacterium]|nr:NAD(P)/FAD-dependent oxidoreductase [Bacteroidia bacterium]
QKSNVSIGIANQVIKLKDKTSLADYEDFLKNQFPENKDDITAIIKEIKKIMGYMDVLYGIDNPAFLDIKKDQKYFIQVIFPWLFKFLMTVRKIDTLIEPVEDYLRRFTKNQALIDIIAQHFFQKTPTSFALSYFSLYLDYHYPKGGTATMIEKLTEYIVEHGGIIKTSVKIERLQPELKYVEDSEGNRTEYRDLIWTGDLKQLYNIIPDEDLIDRNLAQKIRQKQSSMKDLRGGDSVYTVYLTVDEQKDYFSKICTGHFFYTPDKRGLSVVNKDEIDQFMNLQIIESENTVLKCKVKAYISDYFKLNTFEIAIPVLRDADLAPDGKVGVVVSLLFDYRLAKKINDFGWTEEMKAYMEQISIEILDESIFPGLRKKVSGQFSSSPLTIEKLTGNTEGGITGWAFTNPFMPAVTKTLKVNKSVDTPIPSIYQAGQWSYSPSGLPISILTGKLAADKVLKNQ